MGLTRLACHELSSRGGAAIRAATIKETPMTEPLVVRRETQIAAPPSTVFAFLTDPEKIVSWMGAEAQTEMHPGGLYLLKGVNGRRTAGGTLLRMTHSGLPNAAQCAGHNKGWAHYLGRLAMAAAGRNPGIDPGPVLRDA